LEIAGWLRELGLERYAEAFRAGEIEPEILPELTDGDLAGLGIPLGPRKKLLKAIAALAAGGEAAAGLRAEAAHRAMPPEAERRQLTVMFCDVVGSTRLSARLDPEDMSEVIGAYRHRCTELVGRWGGHVGQYLGDGILLYFGYPEAREDDAERAIRCGLEMRTAFAPILADGEPLAVRIGIATGLVMVGRPIGAGAVREDSVVGEALNLAARLQSLAGPNTIVISRSTRRLVGGRFELADLGVHDLKGFIAPVPAWRVLDESPTVGRFEALQGGRLTPLVGREDELDLLLARWRDAKQGRGQVVLLSGEPGIGKSRIAKALRQQLDAESHVCLRYFCSPFHVSSALHPVLEQVQRAAGFERDDSDSVRLDKLEALLGRATARPAEAAALMAQALTLPTGGRYPPLDPSPQRRKEQTFEVLGEQLDGLAARRPVLIVLEDMHWIDPTTRELLDLLVERLVTLPVLLVVTLRDDIESPWGGQPHVTRLPLQRLSLRHSAAMVEGLAPGGTISARLLEEIVGRTDGVPLFLEELTKTVLESSLPDAADDRFGLAGSPSLAVPATLRDSLMARLDRLASVKEIAQVGAVIGREFSLELVAAALGRPEPEIAAALDRLTASELVFQHGSPLARSYSFKHALVQDVAYQSLLKSRRQQLHGRVARVLVERFPELAEMAPELLAHHFGEARLPVPAIAYWRIAGERAAARAANAEAVDHLASALRLLPELPEAARPREEVDLQLKLGFVLLALRGFGAEAVGECYWRALALCEELGERQKGLVARFGLWRFHLVRGEYAAADRLARELQAAAEQDRSAETRLISDWAVGVVSFWLGRLADARLLLRRAAARDTAFQHDLAARYAASPGVTTRLFLSWAEWLAGETAPAQATMAEALALAGPTVPAHSRAWTAVHAAVLHQLLDDVDATRRFAESAIELCEGQRIPHFQAQAKALRGWALAAAGDRETGADEMAGALAQLEKLGNRPMLPYLLTLEAGTLARAGRSGEALARIDAALAESEVSGQAWCNAEIHRVRGVILGQRDPASVAAAEADLRRALEIARGQGALAWERRAATSLAELYTRIGRADEARALLAGLPVSDPAMAPG
jgi:class 3 adenylate cyclase/predicted ATPase